VPKHRQIADSVTGSLQRILWKASCKDGLDGYAIAYGPPTKMPSSVQSSSARAGSALLAKSYALSKANSTASASGAKCPYVRSIILTEVPILRDNEKSETPAASDMVA
jgi:hypothetical protein